MDGEGKRGGRRKEEGNEEMRKDGGAGVSKAEGKEEPNPHSPSTLLSILFLSLRLIYLLPGPEPINVLASGFSPAS